jgi:starch-binding outer membrane protein, SusD/RagB family
MNLKVNNKNFLILSISLVSMVLFTPSCKKYLEVEPISSFGTDYVFSNVENAEKAVLGAYYKLTGDNGYGIRISMYYSLDDDIMMGQGGTPYPDNERRDIAHYRVNANNTQLPVPFNQMYEGVERSNICIYNIPKMVQYSSGSPTEMAQLKRLHGEALTLRAQYYLELIRNWGDIPAQFQPSSLETDLFKTKTDRDTIYARLLDDLKLASTLVPWRNEVNRDERITQGAVRALRARIALYRAGYSLRRSGGMVKGTNSQEYYQIAREECLAIMESNQHQLHPNFETVFKSYIAGKQLDPLGEVIWEVAMGGGNSASGDSKLGYYNGPRVNNNGNSALTILPNYFYMFDSTDKRRDVTCVAYNINANGTTVTSRTGRSLATMLDGKFRRDWIPGAIATGPQYFGVNWPLIRYSDVLLMFAEADNELNNGPSAQAITAFETVRKRAYGGNAALIGVTPTSYSGFFNAIVKERALEFGGEGIRKYDLIRWNMLSTKLAETKAILTAMSLRQAPYDQLPDYLFYKNDAVDLTWANSFYAPNPIGTTAPTGYTRVDWVRSSIGTTILTYYAESFTADKNELLPIPQASRDANPRLTQDYGY